MLSKIKRVEVYRQTKTLSATGQTTVDVPSDNMPGGIIHRFEVRLESADLTGLGAPSATYPGILNSITYGAQNPRFNVMTAINGFLWDTLWTSWNNKATTRTAPVAGGFVMNYCLPFSMFGTQKVAPFRKKDTCLLNIGNRALPFLSMLLGPKTDLGTTITGSPDVVVTVVAVYEPNPRPGYYNPANEGLSGDQPGRYLEITAKQIAALSANGVERLTTGGPRECFALALRQLNSGAVVSDIFNVAPATPSKLEIVKGDSDNYTPRMKVISLDAVAAEEFGAAMTAGHHIINFIPEGKLTDAVDLRDAAPFSLLWDNLTTTASRQLEVVQFNTLDLSADQKAQHAAWLA